MQTLMDTGSNPLFRDTSDQGRETAEDRRNYTCTVQVGEEDSNPKHCLIFGGKRVLFTVKSK